MRQFDRYGVPTPEVERERERIAQDLENRYGGFWRVYSWNSLTRTASAVYGSGARVAEPFASEEEAIEAAQRVILANPDLFRVDLYNLRFDAAPHEGGKWAVHFKQTYRGLEVEGGRVFVVFTDRGRLFLMGSEVYQDIAVDPFPSIGHPVALDIARRGVAFNEALDRTLSGVRLVILPLPRSETEAEYRLVWRERVRTEEPLGIWNTSVDAHSGEIVARNNEICFVDFTGSTSGLVQRPSYCDGQAPEAMPYLRAQVSGVGNTYADADGNWSLTYGGTDARTVTADLYSPYVDLNNVAGAEATFTGLGVPGVPLTVSFDNLNAQRDEKDVYRAVNDIHDFFLGFDPDYSYVNARIVANVSRNATCNAYWDGTINFYLQGGGCANTGEIMGVVHHEFGHGITNDIIGSQGSEGIGEGNSDILANLMTLDPVIGRGFYLNSCASGIRDSENTLRYPDDLNGSIHHDGQIIAGFHWDALESLIGAYGAEAGVHIAALSWHQGRLLLHPSNQPAQVLATFTADDDDGDLTNGTPHYDSFCLGATNHGFSCPEILTGVFIDHTPPVSRTENGDVVLLAGIHSTAGPLLPDSIRVRYRINGSPFQWIRMDPTGNPQEYAATLAALSRPSEVEYYIRARDALGNTRTDPPLAPNYLHSFDVANVIEDFEGGGGWTVNLEGTDNATTGIWVQADPVGTTYNGSTVQPEDDHTPAPGALCWVTGNGAPGGQPGENDVDGGATSLYSGTYNLSGAIMARVKYSVWYTNNRGSNPDGDIWLVQVRNNGGSWQTVENTVQSTNAWALRTFDLHGAFGSSLGVVQFKFVASDDADGSLVEALVDDFELLYQSAADAPVRTAEPLKFALLGHHPNPATGEAVIEFQVPREARVGLSIFDVGGRLVRLLAEETFAAGSHRVPWDGRDDGGRPLAAGVYFYHMSAGGFEATRTVILAR